LVELALNRRYYPDDPIDIADIRHATGAGNWRRFRESGVSLDDVHAAAADWAAAVKGVTDPWLCWGVDPDWCRVQQRQVLQVGWTPVVGFDPRVPAPPVEPGAILIDFNARLRLPTMWPHFPIEFAHLWCTRLAFWHADLLLRPEKMQAISDTFFGLPNGWMAAVKPREGIRHWLAGKRRYWELIGCTTRRASQEAFDRGCGWWMAWPYHPSNSDTVRDWRKRYYWDSGAGIRYWHKHCGGHVHLIPESYVAEGHYTGIGKPSYRRASPQNFQRNLSKELSLNYSLTDACQMLGIDPG
jgi:hypothetical protein